jgi:hypothetical protein
MTAIGRLHPKARLRAWPAMRPQTSHRALRYAGVWVVAVVPDIAAVLPYCQPLLDEVAQDLLDEEADALICRDCACRIAVSPGRQEKPV